MAAITLGFDTATMGGGITQPTLLLASTYTTFSGSSGGTLTILATGAGYDSWYSLVPSPRSSPDHSIPNIQRAARPSFFGLLMGKAEAPHAFSLASDAGFAPAPRKIIAGRVRDASGFSRHRVCVAERPDVLLEQQQNNGDVDPPLMQAASLLRREHYGQAKRSCYAFGPTAG